MVIQQYRMPNIVRTSTVLLLPILTALILYRLDTFDPAPYPDHELLQLSQPAVFVPNRNSHILNGSERIGEGQLVGPEDIAYDPTTGVIYTGCADGWVSRVTVADSVVEKWVNTGGRPLGIVHGFHSEVIVADADKGLLNISKDGTIELLTDEADGMKFKLTDAVDIGRDGTLYFTDASYKYGINEVYSDILEGTPHGRLLSYTPSTKETKALVPDLYFANGVAVSVDHTFVIFCETPMRRCRKLYIEGPRKGSVDMFVENLPGYPDNIRYDGEGHYWIALSSGSSNLWYMIQRYPLLRKVTAFINKHIIVLKLEKNGGVVVVDLNGKAKAHYYDDNISLMSSGIKIGEHLYCGFVVEPYILRLNLSKYPAAPTT